MEIGFLTDLNRKLTRTVFAKIESLEHLPPPAKALLARLANVPYLGPVVRTVEFSTHVAEWHKWAIILLAKKAASEGKLPLDAVHHLRAYELALAHEQYSYNRFLKAFERHV